MPTQWFCRILDTDFGPLAFAELKELADSGTLGQHDLVRGDDSHQWESARGVPGLFGGAATSKPAPRTLRPPPQPESDAPASPDERVAPEMVENARVDSAVPVAGELPAAERQPPPAARPRAPAPAAPPMRVNPPWNWRRIGIAAAIFASLALAVAVADRIQYRRAMRFPPPIAERLRQPVGHFLWGWGPLSDAELVVVFADIVVVGLAISYAGAAVFDSQLSGRSAPAEAPLGRRRGGGFR